VLDLAERASSAIASWAGAEVVACRSRAGAAADFLLQLIIVKRTLGCNRGTVAMEVTPISSKNAPAAFAILVAGALGSWPLRRVGDIANTRRHPLQ
jgi:hypothetical protein